jgi:hypothetical protein
MAALLLTLVLKTIEFLRFENFCCSTEEMPYLPPGMVGTSVKIGDPVNGEVGEDAPQPQVLATTSQAPQPNLSSNLF